jgi:hypothetical protein
MIRSPHTNASGCRPAGRIWHRQRLGARRGGRERKSASGAYQTRWIDPCRGAAIYDDLASGCGGDTRPEKAFSSQCALQVPIGDTSRQKTLRYQQTARPVLNRARMRPVSGTVAAEPDGHTVLMGGSSQAASRGLYPSLSYDPIGDFAPVAFICSYP